MDDPFDDPELVELFEQARRSLHPKVASSSVGITLYSGEVDPKIAIELGYMLFLEKPLILVVMPGVHVPRGIAKAADEIIEWDDDSAKLQAKIGKAVDRLGG